VRAVPNRRPVRVQNSDRAGPIVMCDADVTRLGHYG
jgi:hypothetical protein